MKRSLLVRVFFGLVSMAYVGASIRPLYGLTNPPPRHEASPSVERAAQQFRGDVVTAPESRSTSEASRAPGLANNCATILDGLERHLESIELYVTIALSIAGFIIAAGGALIASMQYRWEREHRQEWDTWKDSFVTGQDEIKQARDQSLLLLKEGLKESLENWKSEVRREVLRECSLEAVADSKKLFEGLSEELRVTVMAQTRVFAQEVLMQTPPARGMLYSRFSRLSRDLASAIRGSGTEVNLHEIIWQGVLDWHTLGQLYSVERDQLKQGLGAVREHPIPEARDWLRTLRNRHRDDSEIVAFVMEAIASLETAEPN